MLKWLIEKLRPVIQEEMGKLKTEIGSLIKTTVEDGMAAKGVKSAAYTYADGILAEGQSMSKEKLDAWWVEQRAKLKTWAGE